MPWIFGYGSLLWRPDFDFEESAAARLDGWERRLLQGSPDHRGVPDDPGRVVTLLRSSGSAVWGRAFRISPQLATDIVAKLDRREQAGYELLHLPLTLAGGRRTEGWVYVAGPENPSFLGSASLESMLEQIERCAGASGTNRDDVLSLDEALASMGQVDDEVRRVASALRRMGADPEEALSYSCP